MQNESLEDIRRSLAEAHNLIVDWHDPEYGKRAVLAQDIILEVILSMKKWEEKRNDYFSNVELYTKALLDWRRKVLNEKEG